MAERDCHYAHMESFYHLHGLHGKRLEKEIEDHLEELYKQFSPNEDRLMVSPLWDSYAYSYVVNFKLLQAGISEEKNAANLRKENRLYSVYMEEGEKYLSGKRKEFFWGGFLYGKASNENFEEELISLYTTFRNRYPESVYHPVVDPLIEKIRIYYEKAANPFVNTICFVENYENINSLKDAVASFHGRKVYVDVWATWCGPCKGQFAYKKEVKEWLAENGYEMLYISIDDPSVKDKWENMVKYYDLEGSHILANQEFQKEIRRLQNHEGGGYFVPWYFLVGENGEIEEQFAKYPSMIAEEKGKSN